MRRWSFVWLACHVAWLGALAPRDARADEPSPRPAELVRIAYDAPADCPSRDAFLARVRSRVGTAWEAPADGAARTVQVTVVREFGNSAARLAFVDENGRPVHRAVSGATCDEVVSAIALVTALAIESRLTGGSDANDGAGAARGEARGEAAAPTETAPAPGASAGESSSAGATSPSAPATSSAATSSAAPAASTAATAARSTTSASTKAPLHSEIATAGRPSSHRRPRSVRFDAGAAFVLATGAAPELAWGPRGFVGFGWERGPEIRLGIDALYTGTVTTEGRPAHFSLIDGRVSGCPIALPFAHVFHGLPCAGVEVGALHAEGEKSNLVGATSTVTRPWVAPFLAARLEAGFGPVFIEAEADLRFPLYRRDFVFETTGKPSLLVYAVPPVALGVSAGAGVRF
ncbi:MAG TPA: hypothetical protein VH142_20330 [Polyangiaceae bacterium]|jgi:hypothetical protein|nr:hypothetical protein [Polyangiaceae bacterium]